MKMHRSCAGNFFDRKKKVREEKAIERDHNLDTYVSSGMTLAIVHQQFMDAIQLISCVKKRVINIDAKLSSKLLRYSS